MLIRLFLLPIVFSASISIAWAVPDYYLQQAKRNGVSAEKLYAVALANAGVDNDYGQFLPWAWSVTVNGNYYQFKTRGELFEYLKAQAGRHKHITYGIAGIPLKSQTPVDLWESLDVHYQIEYASRRLKHLTCSNLSLCIAQYRRNRDKLSIRGAGGTIKIPPVTSEQLNQVIAAVSKETGVEQALLHAIISRESAYNIHAKSHAGAMGLMQLMPDTARYLGLSASEFYDPYKNIKAGASYIKEQLINFDGRLDLALAAYNAGPGAVRKYRGIPPYRETRKYVPIVIGYYRYFKQKMG